eukprot:4826161-Lingulodinium_polyedra.AAC.1
MWYSGIVQEARAQIMAPGHNTYISSTAPSMIDYIIISQSLWPLLAGSGITNAFVTAPHRVVRTE